MKIFENWVQYYLLVWKYLMFKCLNCSNWMRLKQLTFVDSAQLTSFTEQQSKIDFYHFQFFVVVVQPSNKQQLSSQSPCTFVRQVFQITLYFCENHPVQYYSTVGEDYFGDSIHIYHVYNVKCHFICFWDALTMFSDISVWLVQYQ